MYTEAVPGAEQGWMWPPQMLEGAPAKEKLLVHYCRRLSDSCEDGEALSSVHSTALAAGKLIHSLVIEKKIPPMALCAGL